MPAAPHMVKARHMVAIPQMRRLALDQQADEAGVRKRLLTDFGIEIGAGLGPLKGKVWRVGLMGETSKPENVKAFLSALATCLG